ncbi:MAG: bifunctional phosphoribosyl-AMP cyclohydrolase/phosphoribosyl-ATP diphosphatase HisIE [Myxococcales bacterium]|nr:bifunctional phosphoribosyl-AMP cyclohydrolase/phosphoribosyl-ATP diphosphatase HisIE [Myxococcales bacterium]
MELRWDERGLIVTVAQDRFTGEVRMVAWMNQAALAATRESGFATFFSRSRGKLWQKGETSGHRLRVHAITADCDGDTLLLSVEPEGPSCHTGRPSCFFEAADGGAHDPSPVLLALEGVIAARASSSAEKSYTRSLLDGGAPKIGAKLREEAGELAEAIAAESAERVAAESADVLFHLLVALESRKVPLREVLRELALRAGTSGHAEKAARGRGGAGPQQV